MKVAVVQLNAGTNKKKNIQKAVNFVQRAIRAKARLIVLPEAFSYRGSLGKKAQEAGASERIPDEATRPFFEMARRHKVFILAGSVYESARELSEKIFNTSILIGENGRLLAKYRKIHLFDAVVGRKTVQESSNFAAGQQLVTARMGSWNIGLSVCYDLRFPEMYRQYSMRGCHVLTVPSSFTKMTGQAHWVSLLRARAIENLCYVLAPNQCGKDGKGIATYGNSMIISPWGDILAKMNEKNEGVIYAEMDKKILQKARKALPSVNTASLKY